MRIIFQRAALGALVLFAALALAATGASAATRILTIAVTPSDADLASVRFNDRPARLLSRAGNLVFVSVDDGGAGFGCDNTISATDSAGRTKSVRANTCSTDWKVAISFVGVAPGGGSSGGSGSATQTVTIRPADRDLRILTLSLNGAPKAFTAFSDTNRIEFTLRRGSSGYDCNQRITALLSDGTTYDRTGNLCANDFTYVLGDDSGGASEILTILAPGAPRITSVSINGTAATIISLVPNGVRARLTYGSDGLPCSARVDVGFATGPSARTTTNLCTSGFEVTVSQPSGGSSGGSGSSGGGTDYSSPHAWRHIVSHDASTPARLVYQRSGADPVFAAYCTPGSAVVTAYFQGFGNNRVTGSSPSLVFEAGDYASRATGRIDTVPGGSGRYPAVDLRADSGLWGGMIAGLTFSVTADGRQSISYSLRGSAGPVRDFIENCRTTPRPFGPSVIGDVTGDTSLGWRYLPPSGGGKARLRFSDASGERIGLEASCTPEAGIVELVTHSMPTGLPSGRNFNLGWSVDGSGGSLPGQTVSRSSVDWGALGFVRMDAEHVFYRAVAAGNVLTLSVDGRQMTRYSLRGSAGPTRQFVAVCRPRVVYDDFDDDFGDTGGSGGGSGGSGGQEALDAFKTLIDIFATIQNSGSGGGGRPGDGDADRERDRLIAAARTDYNANPNKACGMTGEFTPPGPRPVRTTFTNDRRVPVRLYAYDRGGKRQLTVLGPGDRYADNGNALLGYEIASMRDECLTAYRAPREDTAFTIRPVVERPDPAVEISLYRCGVDETIAVVTEPTRGKLFIEGGHVLQRTDAGEWRWGLKTASFSGRDMVLTQGGRELLNCRKVPGT